MILLFIIIWWFQPIDLSPGDLLYYGGVEWLNISDFLGEDSILWWSPTVSNKHHLNPINHKYHSVNRKDQEGFGTARNVLRLQDRRCLPLQGAPQTEEEVHHCEWQEHYHHDKIIWWSDDDYDFEDLDVMMTWWSDDDYDFEDLVVCENLFTGKFKQVLSGRSGDYPIPSSRPSHRSSGWW